MSYFPIQINYNNTMSNAVYLTNFGPISYCMPIGMACYPAYSDNFVYHITPVSCLQFQDSQEKRDKKQKQLLKQQEYIELKNWQEKNLIEEVQKFHRIQDKINQVESVSNQIDQQENEENKVIKINKNTQLNLTLQRKKPIYKQNPCRNILTNIGNQLITFLCTAKKSRKILLKLIRDKNEKQIRKFYEYTTKIKRSTEYYLNINKLIDFWTSYENDEEKKIKVYIRKLSKYYLRWILPKSILTSKKMCPSSRLNHLKTRRTMMNYLDGKK